LSAFSFETGRRARHSLKRVQQLMPDAEEPGRCLTDLALQDRLKRTGRNVGNMKGAGGTVTLYKRHDLKLVVAALALKPALAGA
jgi:hypothetical protein